LGLLGSTRFSLQLVARAPIEMTFARGPKVAASRGTAVDANHQSLSGQRVMCDTWAAYMGSLSMRPLICTLKSLNRLAFSSSSGT
jgi:hypothetical protein